MRYAEGVREWWAPRVEGQTPVEAALEAVRHVLARVQEDPDLRYHLGPCTESFDRLCVAEALLSERPIVDVVAARARRTTPKHREQRPREEILGARIEQLEDLLDEHGITR